MATITSATISAVEGLHGAQNIYEWTNPQGTPPFTSTNSSTLQTALNACLDALSRRGYDDITQDDAVVHEFIVLFLSPGIRSEAQLKMMEHFKDRFPQRSTETIQTSAIDPESTTETTYSRFHDEAWARMRRVGGGRTFGQGSF